MKTLITVFIFVVVSSVTTSQWVSFTPEAALNISSIHEAYFLDANTGFAGGEGSGKGVIAKTINGGVNWSLVHSTVENSDWIGGIVFVSSNTGFACSQKGNVYKTTNSGSNWFISNQGLNDAWDFSSIKFINEQTGLVCGDGSSINRGPIFRTTNGGSNWYKVNNAVAHMDKIFWYDLNIVYASGDYVVFKSTNGGVNWVDIYPGNRDCNDVFFLNSNTGYVCGNYVMLKTTNAGTNWTEFLISPADTNYHSSVYFTDNNTGYIPLVKPTTYTCRIYKTTNSGVTWLLQQSLNNYFAFDVKLYFIDQNTGFAGGGEGKIWKTTNAGGPIGIRQISNNIPESYSLSQNFPNPFNPSTKIRFDVSKSGNVNISVYDVLGKEIATLVNQQLTTGTYETGWDATKFSSGIYYYRIIAEKYTETRKMVLIK